jgi:ABC-type spermidine/putrescine transport system permease subunit I
MASIALVGAGVTLLVGYPLACSIVRSRRRLAL